MEITIVNNPGSNQAEPTPGAVMSWEPTLHEAKGGWLLKLPADVKLRHADWPKLQQRLGHALRLLQPQGDIVLTARPRSEALAEARQFLQHLGLEGHPTYKTTTGKVLTDSELEDLAAEAERGYDVSLFRHETTPQPVDAAVKAEDSPTSHD